MRRPYRAWFVSLVLPALLQGASSPAPVPTAAKPPPAKKSEKSEWVFSLLPKSLQKNPRLDATIITEMTEAGKKLPAVSPQSPAYYQLFSAGRRDLGHVSTRESTLQQPDIERMLTLSLAANGYRPANPPALPSLLIIYTWGMHALLTEGDEENPVLSGPQIARNLLDRATLVGGEKFSRKLLDLFTQADAMNVAASVPTPPDGSPIVTPEAMAFANPVAQFKRADPKNEFLVDQAASDVYYVVASAYDYQSATTPKRVLLWRTRMTVAASGVSQEQSLPTLIANASPFFGKDMSEAAILTPRSVREGTVEVGTPKVVEPAAEPAASAPAK
jgi:hypothetical protein